MSVNIIHLVCKACGAEVNKIEHPDTDPETRASAVASALGVDLAKARELLGEHGVDPAADAQKLAQSLANPTDSPCPTEGCPGGEVEVTA